MTPPDSDEFFETHFRSAGIMTILRGLSLSRTLKLAERGWDSGVPLLEVPLQGEDSAAALSAAVVAGASRGLPVGAGTIVSVDLVDEAASLGATFTVAPGFDREVADRSLERGLPHLAGVATATEVHAALRYGLRWQKAFPAAQLGAGWITAMHGPFPRARFVATGSIDQSNAVSFLRAGAGAVSLGSSYGRLTPEALRDLVEATRPQASES
jgi:2-dehydro-3-deoxyphosphogluconate aldolase/(4S)-4-hydroxy-2-oxoglutarate aldolase